MRVVLLKDIVILRGTIFDTAPTNTRRFGEGHVEAIFGLSKDSYGTVHYCLTDNKDELRDWFAPVKETPSRKKSKVAGKTSNNTRKRKPREKWQNKVHREMCL
jgi:hypothetical protein